jgi:hypothetical protein
MNCCDVISETVNLLCDGKIVGWYNGRSELGPRALGQRSILCDPRRPEVKDILNSRVKHREAFRPFAPVVLLEHAHEWFDLDGAPPESPFMLRVCKFKDDKKAQVLGVVHIDGTGRFQTVTPETNSTLYQLVKMFYEKTGVPIIINTSFNVAGEPIVETPWDALNTLLSTGLDYCVLGNNIVGKRTEILFEDSEIPWPQRLKHQAVETLNAVYTEKREGGEIIAGVNQSRVLKDYTGTFDHPVQGAIKIEHKDGRLKATIIGGMLLRAYGNLTAPLEMLGQNVFSIAGDYLAGSDIVFLPDRVGRINFLAVMIRERGKRINEAFFSRTPRTVNFDNAFYERFVGVYRDGDKKLLVTKRGNKLIASTTREVEFDLAPIRPTEFILHNLPGYAIEFRLDASSTVTGAIVTHPNKVVLLSKDGG